MKRSLYFAMPLAALLALPLCARGQVAPYAHGHGAPFAHGPNVTVAQAVELAPKQDKSLVPLAKKLAEAQAKLKKSPKDLKVRTAYAETAYNYGYTVEYLRDGVLSKRVQYRAALGLFRKALAVDPHHAKSLHEKGIIETIYRSMPGGVPK